MNLNVGQSFTATLTGSNGSVPASVTANAETPGVVKLPVITANHVTWTANAPGSTVVTYAAAGYTGASETIIVAVMPTLVISDGPAT